MSHVADRDCRNGVRCATSKIVRSSRRLCAHRHPPVAEISVRQEHGTARPKNVGMKFWGRAACAAVMISGVIAMPFSAALAAGHGPLYRWSHQYDACFGGSDLYDDQAAVVRHGRTQRIFHRDAFIQHATLELRDRDQQGGYALSAVRVDGPRPAFLAITDADAGGDVIAGYLPAPPRPVAPVTNLAPLRTTGGLMLGESATAARALLGHPHGTRGCGMQRWAYTGKAGDPNQFGVLIRDGRIFAFYETTGD